MAAPGNPVYQMVETHISGMSQVNGTYDGAYVVYDEGLGEYVESDPLEHGTCGFWWFPMVKVFLNNYEEITTVDPAPWQEAFVRNDGPSEAYFSVASGAFIGLDIAGGGGNGIIPASYRTIYRPGWVPCNAQNIAPSKRIFEFQECMDRDISVAVTPCPGYPGTGPNLLPSVPIYNGVIGPNSEVSQMYPYYGYNQLVPSMGAAVLGGSVNSPAILNGVPGQVAQFYYPPNAGFQDRTMLREGSFEQSPYVHSDAFRDMAVDGYLGARTVNVEVTPWPI